MSQEQPNNFLHGLTLEKILVRLQEHYGWEGLDDKIQINCFYNNPSIKSSLKFLRRTPWARDKVEALYIDTFCR
ncbi:transporter [Vibrio sp. HA2012]|uniref:VF530 family protein n=1 Tax=Vibrio sp. HA2012 TaxID=1971595 RepID=UPI000C2B78B9|nr:VF530 family protein [Vibrio sp. HA2012]PJC87471.1 transporter [Vibrio sp. HA2012]